MDTAPKLFGGVALGLVVLGAYVGFNQHRAKALSARQQPFSSEVKAAKTLCRPGRECFQELYFSVRGKRVTLYSRRQPSYEVGDSVELIKVFKPPLGGPVCGRAGNCRGTDLRESYKLYIDTVNVNK